MDDIIETLSDEELESIAGGAQLSFTEYVVVKGDNLTKIANKFGTTWKKIYALNRNIIKNPNFIEPGWVLTVPSNN